MSHNSTPGFPKYPEETMEGYEGASASSCAFRMGDHLTNIGKSWENNADLTQPLI